jgi:hypothetical protein
VLFFFYVDDIVFCYRKKDKEIVETTRKGLEAKYQLSHLGELKWFLGIHVVRDRQSKQIWLSQQAYVDKLINRFEIETSGKLPDSPMSETELTPSITTAPKKEIEQYQRKTGSILFAATNTRPDIAFASSRLVRLNTNPDKSHYEAADRVLKYLHRTRCSLDTKRVRERKLPQRNRSYVQATPHLRITRSTERVPKDTL